MILIFLIGMLVGAAVLTVIEVCEMGAFTRRVYDSLPPDEDILCELAIVAYNARTGEWCWYDRQDKGLTRRDGE